MEYERLIHQELRIDPAASAYCCIAEPVAPAPKATSPSLTTRVLRRGSEAPKSTSVKVSGIICRTSRIAGRCWTSAADAASSWN